MKQEGDWQKLSEVYQERGLVLALGAGVSYGCKIPSWEELLKRLAANLPGIDGLSFYQQLKEDGYSLPAIASVLEALYPENRFTHEIKNQLYRDFPFSEGIDKENRKRFIKFVKDENLTLAAVASFCTLRDGEESFIPNPRIHAIINTNYDQTLQAYMHARHRLEKRNRFGRWNVIRTIERPSAGSKYGSIPTYYMHGYIRFDKEIDNYRKGAADLRVLTEQDFFDFFNNPNALFNYTFLYLLREYPCLFVGMSLKDDNIRRLLHYSNKERKASHLKEGRKSATAERKSQRHFALIKYPTKKIEEKGKERVISLPQLAEATRVALKRLGVTVLWVEDYSEIRTRLRALYQSTTPKLKWAKVY